MISTADKSLCPSHNPVCIPFDAWDLLITVDGVFFGSSLCLIFVLISLRFTRDEDCDVTAASTVEDDDEDDYDNDGGGGEYLKEITKTESPRESIIEGGRFVREIFLNRQGIPTDIICIPAGGDTSEEEVPICQ